MYYENDDLPQRINALHTASEKIMACEGSGDDDAEYAIVYEGVTEDEDFIDESAPEGKQYFTDYRLEQTLMDSNGNFYSRHMHSEGVRYYGGDNEPEPECEDIKKLKNIEWSFVVEVDNVEEYSEFYLGLTTH